MRGKYLVFKHIGSKPKTEVYSVIETKEDSSLGIIKWYASWRQYCYFPNASTVFSRGCMLEIYNFLEKLMNERKRRT